MNYLLFFCSLLLLACNTSSEAEPADQDSVKVDGTLLEDTAFVPADTLAPAGDSTRQSGVKSPDGIYHAILLHPDGGDAEHIIAFYPDHTYRLQETESGPKAAVITAKGTWKAEGDGIHLYNGKQMQGAYIWQGDTLYCRQENRQVALQKVPGIRENKVWVQKGAKGLEFAGLGTEPFWSVAVDNQQYIEFQLAGWQKPIRFPPVQPVVSGDSILYTAANDSATLSLVVYHRFCSDGMSDFIYDEEINLRYNGQVYKGCGLLYQ